VGYSTYQDAIDHALDYLGGNASDQALRDCKRAAIEAHRTLANAHNWSYLYTHGRIVTTAPFPTVDGAATITYDHSGGTYPRMVTITGAMWPEWAADGTYLRVGSAAYKVDQRKSATVLTLDDQVNPGDDLPAGTAFQLYRDTYLLPADYIAQDQALFEQNFGGMTYTHPREWLYEGRSACSQGTPHSYTVTGDPKWPGRLAMRVFPWPGEARSIDFIYKRSPRLLLSAEDAQGKVSLSLGGNLVTGTGTAFRPGMVGSVLRLSSTAIRLPTSGFGANPAAFETLITSYVSPNAVGVADPAPQVFDTVAYTISDRLDIEEGSMLNAYLRCVEMHLGMVRTLKDKPSARSQFAEALERAKAADSRSFMGRSVGGNRRTRMRLSDYPYNPNDLE
jgi:hypothetical protein